MPAPAPAPVLTIMVCLRSNVAFVAIGPQKEPCSFAWDWGPAYAPVGMWRPIYLQAYDTAVVRDITVETTPHAASDKLRAEQATSRPDASDKFGNNDTSDAAVIARAFRRTDSEMDASTWDVTVTVFLDAGVTDAIAAAPFATYGRSSTPVKGSIVATLSNVTVSAGVTVLAGEEVKVQVGTHMHAY